MGDVLKMMEKQVLEFMGLNPLVELQVAAKDVFPAVLALQETEMRETQEEAGTKLAKAYAETRQYVEKVEKHTSTLQKPAKQEVAKSEVETSTYHLVYFNPETKKAETVEGSVSINYEDETQQVIEEALGQRSAYAAYSFVAAPLVMEHVDEQLMQEIMKKIKIESPDPFAGGAPVQVHPEVLSKKLLEQYGDEIIALEVAEKRRASLEERIALQIMVVDSVVRKLEFGGQNTRKLVEALPPLTKARTLALFRKNKRISRKQVRELLEKDLQFLGAMKTKVGAMGAGDILKAVLKIKK